MCKLQEFVYRNCLRSTLDDTDASLFQRAGCAIVVGSFGGVATL